MKFIPFKEQTVDGKVVLKSAAVIRGIIENPPNGANLSEVRNRLRIIDALEKAGADGMQLEDADHALLARVIQEPTQRYVVVSKSFVEICDDIINAKTVDPLADEPAKTEAA